MPNRLERRLNEKPTIIIAKQTNVTLEQRFAHNVTEIGNVEPFYLYFEPDGNVRQSSVIVNIRF